MVLLAIWPRAICAGLVALGCAVCLLAMSRSDWQYGCNVRKSKIIEEDRERGQLIKKARRIHTYIPVLGT